jgi:hypothetical protein
MFPQRQHGKGFSDRGGAVKFQCFPVPADNGQSRGDSLDIFAEDRWLSHFFS